MLRRNLLYTGLTRGKRLVVLVGQRKAVGIAVRGVQGRRRWSKLKEQLMMEGGGICQSPNLIEPMARLQLVAQLLPEDLRQW